MAKSKASVSDEVTAEVKGPGDEWEGKHADTPESLASLALGIGEIVDEGKDTEVKGPGPEWETNSKGAYKNR